MESMVAGTSAYSVADLMGGRIEIGKSVGVRGWVRTRRDSKGGFSFLSVHDGSCFEAIQVVAPGTLGNYASQIMHITSGCSVIAGGKLVQSQGKGQAYEIQADDVQVIGWVD